MLARREIKKKTEAASSVREFQEKFRIPEGVDVTKLSSEISGDGVLIITGQKREYPLCYQRKVIMMIIILFQAPSREILSLMRATKGKQIPSHPQKPRRPRQSPTLSQKVGWGQPGRMR